MSVRTLKSGETMAEIRVEQIGETPVFAVFGSRAEFVMTMIGFQKELELVNN